MDKKNNNQFLNKKRVNIKKDKLVCPSCSLTPRFTFKDLIFKSECLLNHKHESEKIENFLSDNINKIDYICPEHELNYIYFCQKCKKNICIECYDDHDNHENELIIYTKIKLKKKELEDYKSLFEIMNKYKEKFNKLNTNVIQLKELIGELNNFINIIYNKVNLFWNRFENQYLFNKSILDSYNINNINYNRIMNMKNFYFNKDEYEQFENSINLNKIKELLENINNLLSEKEEINTFITPKYCLNWGLNEAIREIIQNQFDEIVTFIGGKNNLIIEIIGNEIEFSDNHDKKK